MRLLVVRPAQASARRFTFTAYHPPRRLARVARLPISSPLGTQVPHFERGGAVGIAVVLCSGSARPSLLEWRDAASAHLEAHWSPEVVVFTPAIPAGPARRPQRARLAHQFGVRVASPGGCNSWEVVGPVAAGASAGLRLRALDAHGTARAPRPRVVEEELLALVLRAVREHAPGASVHADTPLMDAGIDSLDATRLADQLQQLTGRELAPTLVSAAPLLSPLRARAPARPAAPAARQCCSATARLNVAGIRRRYCARRGAPHAGRELGAVARD